LCVVKKDKKKKKKKKRRIKGKGEELL
jgi:hypothetical protein